MKKIFTAFAAVLLLAGCANKFDDSAILERLANLETRVSELETSVDALRSAIGDGTFVRKVEEYKDPDTGRTTGITVTYTDGDVKWFAITPADPAKGPVVSIIQDGTGTLCWAVDGVLIQLNGANVPVYQTPEFSIDADGNLVVTVDGESVVLGPVKSESEGATLQDGIFTDIVVTDDAVVLTLADGSTVNIPFAAAFRLDIETTEYTYSEPAPIVIPYTVSARTSGTVVDVYYDIRSFSVDVTDEAITVTPITAKSSGMLLAYADTRTGLTSNVKIIVEAEGVEVVDAPVSATVNYLAEGEDATVTANVVSNIEFDVVPAVDWISVVNVKSFAAVITLALQDNETGAYREGAVNIYKKGTETLVQTLVIGQMAKVAGAKDLGKKETANSYIVYGAGDYKFAAVKGNGGESVGAAATAEILWETWNNEDEVTAGSVVTGIALEDGYVTFRVPEDFHEGNAVIAARDAAGTILWSWHIWVPATTVTDLANGLFATSVMDRNLGALVAAEAGEEEVDVRSFGLLYQWGRKDPSVGAKRVSSSGNATVAGTALSAPGLGTMTLEESIQNPTVWYSTENAGWMTEPDNTLWADDAKTVYDPCPPGYRVPARDTAQPFFSSDLTTVTGWAESSSAHWFAMGDPAAVFPFAGYRDDYGVGSVAHAYDRVFIWSAHNNGDEKAYGIDVRAGSRHQYSSAPKSRGAVVRCVTVE